LRALQNTAEQIKGAEPVSAHPPKIRDQLEENNAVIEDLETRGEAFEAVKRAADDVINKAGNRADPAVKGLCIVKRIGNITFCMAICKSRLGINSNRNAT